MKILLIAFFISNIAFANFNFEVISLNNPIKTGTGKFLLKIPQDVEIKELKYKLKNPYQLVSKEKDYEIAALIKSAQGKEFSLPVESYPDGFYRLYIKITAISGKSKLEHEYKAKYHDFVRVEIDRSSTVPNPDPIQNKATVAGIDSDNDGIRDDVQIWINQNYALNETAKKALEQSARAMQFELMSVTNREASVQASRLFMESSSCMSALFGIDEKVKLIRSLRQKMLNSKARLYADIKSDENFSGESYTLPATIEFEKALCSFE